VGTLRKFDVVVTAKNAAKTLGLCCRALRNRVCLNNLIIVVGKSRDSTMEIAKKYGDIVVNDQSRGIGWAREVGLEKVETQYFAYVDADVIVAPAWSARCLQLIRIPNVAACEGVPETTGKYSAITKDALLNDRYCSLSNTMLKTKVVQKVMMPHVYWGEDWELRKRIWNARFEWVVDPDLKCIHLLNDWQAIRHRAHWTSHTKIPILRILKIALGSPKYLFEHGHSYGRGIYEMLIGWASCWGYVNAMFKREVQNSARELIRMD
jgi:glycosyltransferase involved in cell wall biosynthesis